MKEITWKHTKKTTHTRIKRAQPTRQQLSLAESTNCSVSFVDILVFDLCLLILFLEWSFLAFFSPSYLAPNVYLPCICGCWITIKPLCIDLSRAASFISIFQPFQSHWLTDARLFWFFYVFSSQIFIQLISAATH